MIQDTYAERLAQLRANPAASFWIKTAAAELDRRDPVDAISDAEHLLELARQRVDEILSRTRTTDKKNAGQSPAAIREMAEEKNCMFATTNTV